MSMTLDRDASIAGTPAKTEARRAAGRRPKRARWPALLTVAGILAIWQIGCDLFEVPTFIAPTPWLIMQTFWSDGAMLLNNFWPTLMEALIGFVVGNTVAIALAIWFVHSKTAELAVYPIAVFINTIPIIAIAPILVLLLGNGYAPKIVIAGLICFFPTLVNMVRGLKAVSPATLDLMRVLSATKSEVLWKLRLQSSLPFLFAALKIASTTCVIGAIVGEWIGSNFGLGALIIEATYNYRSPLLYATVFVCAGLAVLLFSLVGLAEQRVVRWKSPAVF